MGGSDQLYIYNYNMYVSRRNNNKTQKRTNDKDNNNKNSCKGICQHLPSPPEILPQTIFMGLVKRPEVQNPEIFRQLLQILFCNQVVIWGNYATILSRYFSFSFSCSVARNLFDFICLLLSLADLVIYIYVEISQVPKCRKPNGRGRCKSLDCWFCG